MSLPRIVIDTNTLVSAARSRHGASFQLLSLVGTGKFEICVSVALALEYEEQLLIQSTLGESAVRDLIDYSCSVARRQKVFFLWRPWLRDPGDDMVLELAVAARANAIVTFNARDFHGADRLGIHVMSPRGFLEHIGELP